MRIFRPSISSLALAMLAGCATGENLETGGTSSSDGAGGSAEVDSGFSSGATASTAGGTSNGGGASSGGVSDTGGARSDGSTTSSGGIPSADAGSWTGGATSTGGTSGAGGSGGTSASGGTSGSGGASASGGSTSTGGSAGSGGTSASGGTSGSGGAPGSGGTSSGGTTGSGGTSGSGGSSGCPADSLTSSTTGCPGELLTLTGSPLTATATGSMGNGSGTFNSIDCGSADGDEHIYRFVAPSDGTVDVALQHGFYNAAFYVRAACDGGPSTLACSDSGKQNTTETISLSVQACQTYYVFSDKRSSCCSTGSYTLTVKYR